MKRQSLNGTWKYRIGKGKWSEREVPFSALAVGHSECERTFNLEESGERVELRLDGITYSADVYLNGVLLGKMLPYCEYSFDITEIATPRDNSLHIELEDIAPEFGPVAGWENFGGIIRDVYVVFKNTERIENVFFSSELQNGYTDARIKLCIDSASSEGCTYEISLFNDEGELLFTEINAAESTYHETVNDVKLWSPDAPNLYNLQIKLVKNGVIKDVYTERVGFREIKCERHRFLLNGEPLFLRGVCKHEMIADSGHTVKYEDVLRDMRMIKELGCNFVRLVHYPHGKAVLDIADEIGLMVSEEPGLWWSDTSNAAVADGSIEVLRRTILRDRNHPSIVFWLCFNECKFTEDFLIRSAAMCKLTDPTRLVSGANCMSDEETLKYFNVCGFDFYTMHPYAQTFERARRSAKILNDKPLVFTEWGGHFVYDNPKLMREFILEMKKLYSANSDSGALAGAFLWAFAEVNDFNRERPAVVDGRLLEGLVDAKRNPQLCFNTFRDAWNEPEYHAPFCIESTANLPEKLTRLEYLSGGTPYGILKDELYGALKPDFLTEQRPRVIKVGPVCEKPPIDGMYCEPLVLTGADKISFSADEKFDGITIIGGVSATVGYPLSGERGECAATLRLNFEGGDSIDLSLRNGIEVTSVYTTYRSSRINPVAERAERFAEFSYDKSFECYVINKIVIPFNERKRVASAELLGADNGYALLTYGIFGYTEQ